MQVFVVLAVLLASACAKGSGPYLPSGWKPSGPAFYLPNEVQKPVENLQDALGSEASGSDALREYGPPKLDLSINQGLPDVAIEQNFVDAVVSSGDGEISSIVLGRVVEESAGNAAALEQTTEGQIQVEVVYEKDATVAAVEEISERSLNGEILAEINIDEATTALPTQEQEVAQDSESTTVKEVESVTVGLDVIEKVEAGRSLEQIVPEVLANLENAVKSEVDITQQITDSTSQETSGSSEQVPEGFLEYGPPGFKEYGLPKEDLNVVAIQSLLGQASVETNEARRRRFSPKFKPVKKLH